MWRGGGRPVSTPLNENSSSSSRGSGSSVAEGSECEDRGSTPLKLFTAYRGFWRLTAACWVVLGVGGWEKRGRGGLFHFFNFVICSAATSTLKQNRVNGPLS